MIAATAAHFGERPDRLLDRDRSAPLVWQRQLAMYLATQLTGRSLPAIGRVFDRDHTTILHARKCMADRVQTCPATAAAVDAIRARLT